jgi:hypothetical protein
MTEPKITLNDLYYVGQCMDALDYPLVSPNGTPIKFEVDEIAQTVILSFSNTKEQNNGL